MKYLIIVFFSVLVTTVAFNQENPPPPPPPPMDMPQESNEPMIDKLIKVAKYELLFDLMKKEIIQQYAERNNWNPEKIKEVESSIHFKEVSGWVFYNGYASESVEELQLLIARYEKMSDKELVKEFPASKKIILINFENIIRQGCKKYE